MPVPADIMRLTEFKVLCPTKQAISRFGDVLPSQRTQSAKSKQTHKC